MNIIKQLNYNNFTIRIFNDFRNPRRDYYNYGKIITNNNDYQKHKILTQLVYSQCIFSDLDLEFLQNEKFVLSLPIFLNNKNHIPNITLVKSDNLQQIGWYVLPQENYQIYAKQNNLLDLLPENLQNLKNILIHEINLFNAFKTNNLFSYEIIDNTNNIIQSSGLFIGIQETEKNAIKQIEKLF